jgi:hypothetical protein
MALTELQLRECLRAVGAFISKRRPRPAIRDKLDYRADIDGVNVTIVAVRPAYKDATRLVDEPVARTRWIGTRQVWRLYWMRADLKWHRYEPFPESPRIAAVLSEVDSDPHGCFFG